MYFSRGDATACPSLLLAGYYIIWPAWLGSPGYTGRNLAKWVEIKSYYIITRETIAHKNIYDHLSRMVTVYKIINAKPQKHHGRPKINANACCYCNANATGMHKRSPLGFRRRHTIKLWYNNMSTTWSYEPLHLATETAVFSPSRQCSGHLWRSWKI